MIFYDVTKSAAAGHRSGLMRVNARLRGELGDAVRPVEWGSWDRAAGKGDWFFTAELFSEGERPGWGEFVRRTACRRAAVFYDAIPLKHPHITWPQSVARHPGYMKLLASFDRIWAISSASRDELLGFWKWAGVGPAPVVDVLALGADFNGEGRNRRSALAAPPSLLSVGILEPRKNQDLLLDVVEELWSEGLEFELHLAGRCNPHFGRPIRKKIAGLSRRRPGLKYHASAGDADVARLYARARASVFPTLAEGCGLPVIESLWMGVPCVCSDLPVLRENFAGGGCLPVPVNDRAAWKSALRAILTDDSLAARLAAEAASRPLPTWAEAARAIREKIIW